MDILRPGKTVTRYLYSDFKYRTVFLVQILTFNNLASSRNPISCCMNYRLTVIIYFITQLERSWVKRLTLSLRTRISAGRVPCVSSVKLRKYWNILSIYNNDFLLHSSQYFIHYHFIIRRHINLAASSNKTQMNIYFSFFHDTRSRCLSGTCVYYHDAAPINVSRVAAISLSFPDYVWRSSYKHIQIMWIQI